MALDYPELPKLRTALKCFNVFYVLAHYGKLAEPWEEGKPNHARKPREEDLQGADVASLLCNFFIAHSIGHALLRNIVNSHHLEGEIIIVRVIKRYIHTPMII